jgi:hypothetical protein
MQRSLIDEVEPSQQLLYWTLLFALYPFFVESSSFVLHRILSQQGAVRGSPGWEIDFIENDMGDHVYHVWADPANSGIEPANQYFSVEMMRDAVRKSLLYMGKNFPEKTTALSSALVEYKLR